jgi:hypothetical protein
MVRGKMFRTVLFSLVFSLAVGQSASLLCKALCDPAGAAAIGCHDHGGESDSSARIVASHDCDDQGPAATAFLTEDARGTASLAHADPALAVARHHAAAALTAARPDHGPGHLPSLEKRPLKTALRI